MDVSIRCIFETSFDFFIKIKVTLCIINLVEMSSRISCRVVSFVFVFVFCVLYIFLKLSSSPDSSGTMSTTNAAAS